MSETSSPIERRTLLRGVAITGAAVAGGAVLAGCGGDEPVADSDERSLDGARAGGLAVTRSRFQRCSSPPPTCQRVGASSWPTKRLS